MPKTRAKKSFVVCLSNDGYAAALEPRKIYVALRDAAAECKGLVRGRGLSLLARALRAAQAAARAAAGHGCGR